MSQPLQAESKTKKLVDFGRAFFKRQSDTNTISARSQRLFRASKPKDIWKSGLKQARNNWTKVLKHKRRTKRESAFDTMYPVGRVPSQFLPNLPEQNPYAEQDPYTDSLQSLIAALRQGQHQDNRHSSTPSVAVTTPTPSNSQRIQGHRQSQYFIHETVDEPSPLFVAQDRPKRVTIAHPPISTTSALPTTPLTAHSTFQEDYISIHGRSRTISANTYTSDSSSISEPNTASFPGQVNPKRIAKRRQSENRKRDSHEILDGVPRSDRDQLPSQISIGDEASKPVRSTSMMPPTTSRVLRPGDQPPRPLTTHFEVPEPSPVHDKSFEKTFGKRLSFLPYDNSMQELGHRLSTITGGNDKEELSAAHKALNALTGELPPAREPSAVSHYEVTAAMAYGNRPEWPGKGGYRESKYQAYKIGKQQKPAPSPPSTPTRPRPVTPATPPHTFSKGKRAADARIQENLCEAREQTRKRHARLSRQLDYASFGSAKTIREKNVDADSSSSCKSRHHSATLDRLCGPEEQQQQQQPPPPKKRSRLFTIRRKPVPTRSPSKKVNTNKPLPKVPAERSSVVPEPLKQNLKTPPRSRPQEQPQTAATRAPDVAAAPSPAPSHHCNCPHCRHGASTMPYPVTPPNAHQAGRYTMMQKQIAELYSLYRRVEKP